MRHLRDLSAGWSRDSSAADKGILKRVTAGDLPRFGEIPIQADFVAVGALAAGLHDSRRIVWVGRSRVGSIQAISGSGERQRTIDVPLHADFIIAERLRLDLLRDRGQGRELIT